MIIRIQVAENNDNPQDHRINCKNMGKVLNKTGSG